MNKKNLLDVHINRAPHYAQSLCITKVISFLCPLSNKRVVEFMTLQKYTPTNILHLWLWWLETWQELVMRAAPSPSLLPGNRTLTDDWNFWKLLSLRGRVHSQQAWSSTLLILLGNFFQPFHLNLPTLLLLLLLWLLFCFLSTLLYFFCLCFMITAIETIRHALPGFTRRV